jgi:membrane protein implicated in regulation of membrane protease activity
MVSPSQKYGLLFTVGRVAIFLVCAAVLSLLHLRPVWIMIGALALSVPISYVLLKPIRLRWSAEIDQSLQRRRESKEKLRSALRGEDA